MIYGEVTAHREAVVQLLLCGKNGLEIPINATIDTGFTENLTLPASVISTLGYSFAGTGRAKLGDGSVSEFDIYRGTVLWNHVRRTVLIQVAECEPLMGMSLLYGCTVTLHVVDGGEVTIEPDNDDD